MTEKSTLLENSLFWTVISVLVGVIFRTLALRYGAGSSDLAFLIGAAGVILTLQIGSLYRHSELSNKVEILKDELSNHTRRLERHGELKQSIAFLEPAIEDDHFLQIASKIAVSYGEVQRLKKAYPRCKDFFDWKEASLFQSLVPKLHELSQRQIVIDSESKELTTNKDFLMKLPVREVRAVSYQDAGFYDEPEGKDFLRAHTQKKQSGVNISRIFILDETEVVTQREVVEQQVDLGIDVRIIPAGKVKLQEREDFVIYDSEYVRVARLCEYTGTTTLKHATLIVDTDKVKEYIERYESLDARSSDATDFYSQRDLTVLIFDE